MQTARHTAIDSTTARSWRNGIIVANAPFKIFISINLMIILKVTSTLMGIKGEVNVISKMT
jgi:hypothetical protein